MSELKLASDLIGAIYTFQSLGGICIICNSTHEDLFETVPDFKNSKWIGIIDQSKIIQLHLPLYALPKKLTSKRENKFNVPISDAVEKHNPKMIALLGYPRISTFGVDIASVCKLLEDEYHRPALAIGFDGKNFYDDGIQEIYLASLFRLTEAQQQKKPFSLGVLGVTPFDFEMSAIDELKVRYTRKGWQKIFCVGMDSGLDIFRDASSLEENLVVAPSGFPAARFLQKTFGIPFHIDYPLFMSEMPIHIETGMNYDRILIVHQQFKANSFRHWLQTQYPRARIVCASFFMMQNYLCQPYDRALKSTDDFTRLVYRNKFNCIIADKHLKKFLPENWNGDFFEADHFAISE